MTFRGMRLIAICAISTIYAQVPRPLSPPPTANSPPTANLPPTAHSALGNRSTIAPRVVERSRTRKTGFSITEPELYCLDEFELNTVTNRCEKQDRRSPEIGCPTGWKFEQGTCKTTAVQPADRFCPEEFDNFENKCRKRLIAPLKLVCPQGYEGTALGCTKDVETQPIQTCPEGEAFSWSIFSGTLEYGRCVVQLTSKPIPLCGTDFEPMGTMCGKRVTTAAEYICPAGHTLKAKECVMSIALPPALICPSGVLSLDGICLGLNKVAPNYICEDRSIPDHNGFCTEEVVIEPKIECPPQMQSIGDLCEREETSDPIYDCPTGTQLTSLGCSSGKTFVPPSKSCPPGFHFHGKEACQMRVVESRVPVCPRDFAFIEGMCRATDHSKPGAVCPAGTILQDSICVEKLSFEAVKKCPNGLVWNEGERMCIGESVVAAIGQCRVGNLENDVCVSAEVVAADVSCPAGSTRRLDSSVGVICEETRVLPAEISCPRDFELSRGGKEMTCSGRALVEGKMTCIEPFRKVEGDQCEFLKIVPKILGCIDGGILKGTSCLGERSQPPVVMCPDGYRYKLEGQICYQLLWSPPLPKCPKGYLFDELVEKCYASTEDSPTASTLAPQEVNLPLGAAGPSPPFTPATETTTKGPVKVKMSPPHAGKEQFIPIQTFTGSEALEQASRMEALKLSNQAVGGPPPQAVAVPKVDIH